jgi:hypothetical protein
MRHELIPLGVVVGAIAFASASGCGTKKITECNNLVNQINAGVASLEKGAKQGGDPNDVAGLKAMAEAMDKVAGDTAKVEVSIPELKKFSTDYQGMTKEVAKAFRDMAAAAEAKDMDKINAAQQALDKAVKQEDPLVENINKFCSGS